jgi:acetyl esterase/lipase
MKNRPSALHLVILSCCWMTTLHAEPNPTTHVAPGKVYIYKTSHGQPQKMEVYFPETHGGATNKVPGVLLFHGGGWKGGDLNQFRYACAYFAKRGLVAATANYYMHSEDEAKNLPRDVSRKRACVTDAVSALRWFKQHADELGIDPNRIIIGGGSAGGHIALLATLQRELDDPADPKEIDTSVLGYLFFCSAFTTDSKDNDKTVDAFAQLKPGIAPSLFLFGEEDSWLPATEKLVPALRKTGARAELLVADKVGHMFFMQPEWYDTALTECDRFLVSLRVLSGEPLVHKPATMDFDPKKSSM